MITLTQFEQKMLDGKHGELKQKAIENIVKYAEILGADSLCTVSRATLFCGKHSYLAAGGDLSFHEMYSKVQLSSDKVLGTGRINKECQAQTCVSPCESCHHEELGQNEAYFNENQEYLNYAKESGIVIAGSCAPYLNGWIPLRGEHFVTTESGMTILGNSLWGACCNSDGIEAAFWSGICARTPKWGRHTKEGRKATAIVNVTFAPDEMIEWDLLGHAIGRCLPLHTLPVLVGDFSSANFNKIRQLLTAVSASSNCEMCHIVGLTPEASTLENAFQGSYDDAPEYHIHHADLTPIYNTICDAGEHKLGLVSLGCPHYDIYQIQTVAELLHGKHIASGVDLQVWTTYPMKAMADQNGFTKIIKDAGGKIFTSSCPTTINSQFLLNYSAALFDSVKQNNSVRSQMSAPKLFGTVERCIEAAIAGEWKEECRWNL